MRLLLHMCCAPCSVYPVSVLQEEGIELEGMFYNPNIHPMDEHIKRRENVEKFSKATNLKVCYFGDFKQDVWESFQGDELSRCAMCYSLRLERAAAFAAENGFDAFSTTLLVSPYQKHELIKQLGEKYAGVYGVKFHYRDFRPGFRQGQQQAREMGLYRQKYCGCIISKNN
jgi:epoxyqueuosine reductase